MQLPDEILAIVRDFSRPVTQPGWRTFHKMTTYHFHYAILNQYNTKRTQVIYKFVRNYNYNPSVYIYCFEPYVDYQRRTISVHLRLIQN